MSIHGVKRKVLGRLSREGSERKGGSQGRPHRLEKESARGGRHHSKRALAAQLCRASRLSVDKIRKGD